MITSKPDPLVDEDYYEKGLNYDSEVQRMERMKKDSLDSAHQILRHE
jgi:hypothetical protein